jgi:hypothetical protein
VSKRLFVSYSRNDADAVDTLVSDASSLGNVAWVDRQLSGGQHWWSEVLRQIRECDVFVFALSPDAVNSQACESEYAYAAALGKPILPVLVKSGVSDTLLPRALAGIQQVDYTGLDKAALSALVRGLSSVAEAGELPAPLPAEPEVPATYLFDLKEEIGDALHLSPEKQQDILLQVRERIREGHDADALRKLLDLMRGREDLLVRTAAEIDSLETQLSGGTPPEPPVADRPEPQPTVAAEPQPRSERAAQTASFSGEPAATPPTPSAAAPPQQQVNPAWWVAPILFGIIGGIIAWAVNKDADADTARNMMIAGVVASVVWFALL